MDCVICNEAITASTGKVDLSCSHSFHFSCLTSWFATQNGNEHTQSCPYCRHESNEHEKMLTTFIYPINKAQEIPLDMRAAIADATAAAERAALAFLEARTAVTNFLNSHPQEPTLDFAERLRQTDVAADDVRETQVVARWFFE